MRLSTKGRYAVTAMMELALGAERGPVTLSEISSHQGISLSYLEQLFARMRRRGLVVGVRGPGGGYRLAKAPGEISVAEIITAVDERADQTQGVAEAGGDEGRCLTHDLWVDLSRQIYEFLDGITLEQLAADGGVQRVTGHQDAGAAAVKPSSAA